jgi:hypothetical protein
MLSYWVNFSYPCPQHLSAELRSLALTTESRVRHIATVLHIRKAPHNCLGDHLIAQLGYMWNIHVMTELARVET